MKTITLTEELKTNTSTKLRKIKKIAKEMRRELETYHDWKKDKACFAGKCYNISKKLAKKLNENGLYSYKAMGQYMNADASYTPDMSDWNICEKTEYLNFLHDHVKENIGYTHWW